MVDALARARRDVVASESGRGAPYVVPPELPRGTRSSR